MGKSNKNSIEDSRDKLPASHLGTVRKLSLFAPKLSVAPGKAGSLRLGVLGALSEALNAASPEEIISSNLRIKQQKLFVGSLFLDLTEYNRVIVIGAGKASARMAAAIEVILSKRITGGLVISPDYLKHKENRSTKLIQLHYATHPTPSLSGVKGVEKILRLVGKPQRNDLVICLISGGGSALMPLPLKGITLQDKIRVTELLLRSGASIDEINIVRKHMSGIKGGRLAERLYPARVLSLIISDVVGDNIESIASGPTVPDPSTFQDAVDILIRLNLWRKIPKRVKVLLRYGSDGQLPESPKKNSKVFSRVSNVLVGTNRISCEAARKFLESRGYRATILSSRIEGEAKEVGKVYSGILREMNLTSSKSALIFGGETTVTIQNRAGLGGRNQELVLSAALGIRGLDGAIIASMGTDGIDGPTNAAGAIADGSTIDRAKTAGLDAKSALRSHNAYPFFKKLRDLIVSGPTGTNVNDISILAVNTYREKGKLRVHNED